MNLRRFALIFGFAALLIGVAVNMHPKTAHTTFSAAYPLSRLSPAAPKGWIMKESPLASTELMVGETLRTLNLTDYFYRTYSHEGMEVRIYVAYWSAGQLDPREVWAHQPDHCWTANGGIILERDDSRILAARGVDQSCPALFRVFQFPTGREEVVFWHLIGGHVSGFDWTDRSPMGSRWRHLLDSLHQNSFGFAPKEQLVVRISTNRSIDALLQSRLWPPMVDSLRPTGIFDAPSLSSSEGKISYRRLSPIPNSPPYRGSGLR